VLIADGVLAYLKQNAEKYGLKDFNWQPLGGAVSSETNRSNWGKWATPAGYSYN
jgi:hypothetical protein